MRSLLMVLLVFTTAAPAACAAEALAPVDARSHLDAPTLALYNRIRTAPGWLLGVGALVERDPGTGRIPPAECERDLRRWQALYKCGTPACYEFEVGERANRSYQREWKAAAAFADRGGVPWFMFTLKNFTVPWGPARRGSANDATGGLDPVLPGGAQHEAFVAYIRQLAGEFKAFGRPCVFRPFHEMNGRWFWWGGQPEKLKQVWRLTFDLFTEEGVRNVIWCWAASGDTSSRAYYPGDDVVDIAGTDQYFDAPRLSDAVRANLAELARFAPDKPLFLCELGPMARDDFWNGLAADLQAVPHLRGLNVWWARGWRPWGSDPARGSFIDETSPAAVVAAFKGFLVRPEVLTLERFSAGK